MQVKPELQKEFDHFVEINSKDDYSKATVDGAFKVGEVLDTGGTPAEAENAMNGLGLTGFMAGMIAQIITRFHPRGEEYRQYWNKEWGKPEAKGVVNPAIITIG